MTEPLMQSHCNGIKKVGPHKPQEGDEWQADDPTGGGEGPGHGERPRPHDQVEHIHQAHLSINSTNRQALDTV